MEDMDIDSIVDIPDTPDRLSVQRMNREGFVEKEGNLSGAGHVGGSDSAVEGSLDRLGGRGRLVVENEHNRKHFIHPRKLSGSFDETECRKNTIVLSPLENARENAPLFRKTAMERSRNSIREKYVDNGKAPCSKLPSKSSGFQEDNAILDLTEQNWHKQIPERAFPQGGSKNHLAEGRKEGQVPRNGGSYFCNSSNNSTTSGNNCKGKEKIDDIKIKSVGSVMDHREVVGLSHGSPLRMEKHMSASHHSVVSPRAVGKKRLVRNGCISPQNIASRAKQLNEQSLNCFKAEQDFGNVVSNGPCMIDISEVIAEDNNGKGSVVHPHTSKEPDINFINLCDSPRSNNREATGFSDLNRDVCSEEKGGWRSTHNHSKIADHAAGCHFSRFNNVRCQVNQQNENTVVKRDNARDGNNGHICDRPQNHDATETAPVIFSKFNQINEPSHAKNMLHKRQTLNVLNSRNSGESSRVIPNDSDILFLGSSREPSSSRSSRIHIGQHLDALDLDESSGTGGKMAFNMDCDEDSEARARQVEADEILARELQEQLYHEVPIFGGVEIDENIAWALQQAEHALHPTSIRSLHEPDNARASAVKSRRDLDLVMLTLDPSMRGSRRHSRIQPHLQTFQNSSNRRGVQTHFPTSARVSRLRSRVLNQTQAAPSRTRNFRFPFDMDLDMRLDILEAMEAAFGDADDMGMASQTFEVERDFNENDYEMLLALDDNNHQHGGASINQINSLPLSKVQTDNFEEVCAVCLETQTIGETIRHLPCLHKFHKDCIDPWLSRKTSCPVCKSSIT